MNLFTLEFRLLGGKKHLLSHSVAWNFTDRARFVVNFVGESTIKSSCEAQSLYV